MCLPTWFSPESGTVEGTSAKLAAPPPPHVKYKPHGRGVDHRLICPVGESGYPDGADVFLCRQPLYDPATTGREVEIVSCAVNCDDKIYGCSLCHRGELMGWSWTSVSSFYSCVLFLWPCWLVRWGGCEIQDLYCHVYNNYIEAVNGN